MKKRLTKVLHWMAYALLLGGMVFLVSWFAFPFPEEDYRHYDASRCITDKDGNILRTTLNGDSQRCLPVRLDDAGKWLPQAMVATEDKRFYTHNGVDILATTRAAVQMVWNRRVVSGASTITSQVIRLVKPRPRNLASKVVEAFRALQMETLFTKKEILEQYLNRSPFGGNLVGIRAASLYYYSKEPADLSIDEATLLAGLPQSPNRLRPDRHPERALKRRETVLKCMANNGMLEHGLTETHAKSPIRLQPWKPPFFAPHFVDAVLQGRILSKARSKPYQTQTTLDLNIQQLAEDHLSRQASRKAQGAAIIILDAPSRNILAMVGSPDFEDLDRAGQYNAALALRSPGSTLKTFANALAFDQGLLTPASILHDEPSRYAGYRPVNYDETFRGKVSARQALVESLNLPAVEVLQSVGTQAFLDALLGFGIHSLDQPAKHYGLNLVLGGAGVRPLELARAYARLASPRPGDPVSAEAAWLASNILSGSERDFVIYGHTAKGKQRPRIAWKTGTSAQSRDAWTVAWNPQYVVCIWLGNPDGSPCPGLTGIEDAAPLALETFSSLPHVRDIPRWPSYPLMLEQRKVCQGTGRPISKECGIPIKDWHIPGVSRTEKCDGSCAVHAPTEVSQKQPPRIVAPVDGQTFALLPGQLNPTLPLKAEGGGELYWFVNGAFHAKSTPGNALRFPMEPGRYLISCTTGSGVADTAEIVVE